MTDLPLMVPSAEERATGIASVLADHIQGGNSGWSEGLREGRAELVALMLPFLTRAAASLHGDGQASRQPEIDALRALLDEAERALQDAQHYFDGMDGDLVYRPAKDLGARWDKARQSGIDALARIREAKRDG